MFRTDDNYNLYFDGVVSKDSEANFNKLIEEYQLDAELAALLKRQHNFRIYNSYEEHKMFLWSLYRALGPFAITIFFAEDDHPRGCEYQARVDFYIDGTGNFDYELKNSLFRYEEYELTEECKERIEQKLVGFEEDCRIKGSIGEMNPEAFVKSITAE
jgi:hypothetical protein